MSHFQDGGHDVHSLAVH